MKRAIAVTVAAVLVFFAGWMLVYPSPDPKSIQYVLWKAGLCKMDLDTATGTMVGDAARNRLVIGKTQAELQAKFGYLLPLSKASEYFRTCVQGSAWDGRRVLFIRQSPWMVVFDGDKATDLVLIKGC